MKVHNEINIMEQVPAVALRGLTVLPELIIHFDVSREKSIQAVEAAMASDRHIFLVTQRNLDEETPAKENLYEVGVYASVQQIVKIPGDIMRVLVKGEIRARMCNLYDDDKMLSADIELHPDEEIVPEDEIQTEAYIRELEENFLRYCMENPSVGKGAAAQMDGLDGLPELVNFICNNLPMYYEDRQKLLEQFALTDRYRTLLEILHKETGILEIRKNIQMKTQNLVEQNQKEYVLREQIRAIHEELGDLAGQTLPEEWKERTDSLDAPQEVKDKLNKEIARYQSQNGSSSENGVIQDYIETILELPWNICSKDGSSLKRASRILETDHYGLEKVKERILEYLAVRILNEGGEAPILCLVGPPGTGKTSIARSIARALNKEYVRISLGGVRDEAEIRGHRRTYVGSMPGRIINGIRHAGVSNPLMLLDEIDKLSSDYKGDTASALLEVLDSEQNCHFRDHYVDLPFDLSKVMFVATANSLQTIPRPLLDRMEVIEVSSYTANEKYHIAAKYLVPKQLKKNGLKKEQLSYSRKALERIIDSYTREAGVRELERTIGRVCRKAARTFLETDTGSIKVTPKNLEQYLGKEKYIRDKANDRDEVGIVRGLAWTAVGGDTLEIEVNVMPGKGEVRLTGQMGDVMQESAMTGISYIRSVADKWKIDREVFKEQDIHIHIPEGAVSKDGPSAGITMATAVLSALMNIPADAGVAMTGEITLRGRVLPIGGLKEKLLAAKQAGIKKVLVPERNKPDVEEISDEIKGDMDIVYVQKMEQVIKETLHATVPGEDV